MLEMGWNLIESLGRSARLFCGVRRIFGEGRLFLGVLLGRRREAQAGMQATIIETLSSMVLVWVEQMPIQTTLRGCLLENVDSIRPVCQSVSEFSNNLTLYTRARMLAMQALSNHR